MDANTFDDETSPRGANHLRNEELIYRLLSHLGVRLGVTIDRSRAIAAGSRADANPSLLNQLEVSAEQSGIYLRQMELDGVEEATAFIREDYPIVVASGDQTLTVVDSVSGGKFDSTRFGAEVTSRALHKSELRELMSGDTKAVVYVAKRQFDCDSASASPYLKDHHGGHAHLTPLRRFSELLKLESADIWTVVLFALVSGVLTLATPLAVESLVNVVSWGTYLQPLVVLGMLLLLCLGIAGILRVLQTFVVELIQRRQFVRIVSDLAHRFPRANQESLDGEYPRELANRVFDIMTIQKATAVLLLDGVSIVLTTILGMVLLAFYHPFLLGFDIILLIAMISITWILGRGGIRTAIEESITKYRVAHWLQDVIASPTVFKAGGGESLAIQRANQLTADYITARKRQFNVVIRQAAFAILLQTVASTAVLALGGWLVIEGELTLGQLVASELVVTVVVGAFAKAGKSLEKFYDLMAGVDKVGHLIDIEADRVEPLADLPEAPVSVGWSELTFQRSSSRSVIPAATIPAGSRAAIVGNDLDGGSDLARTLAGLRRPTQGVAQVGEFDPSRASLGAASRMVGYAGGREIFHGSIRENVDLGRPGLGAGRVREVLANVGLSDAVLRLSDGVQTHLQTGGYPLSATQTAKLVIARAIAPKPRLVILDGILDQLSPSDRVEIWKALTAETATWTLIVVTGRDDVASLCDTQISVRAS